MQFFFLGADVISRIINGYVLTQGDLISSLNLTFRSNRTSEIHCQVNHYSTHLYEESPHFSMEIFFDVKAFHWN